MAPADCAAVGALVAEYSGAEPGARADALARFLRERARDDRGAAFVAVSGTEVLAYAKTEFIEVGRDDGPDDAPSGWYLSGMVVAPAWRRKGIGSNLTRVRLRWLAGRTEVVYYVANARNAASAALHARFGFRELRPIASAPGVRFREGAGVLYALALTADHRHSAAVQR